MDSEGWQCLKYLWNSPSPCPSPIIQFTTTPLLQICHIHLALTVLLMFWHPFISHHTTLAMSLSWSFPSTISQSTILGRSGSNACTLIALLFSKLFFSSNVVYPAITSPLSQTWVYQIIVQGILIGNRIYDSITQHAPQTFGVSEALQVSTVLNNVIGLTTMSLELPASIVPEASPSASLPYHWRQALMQGKTTSIFILQSNTVVFIPTPQGIFLLDSHFHGNSGAHVAFAEWQHAYDLLSWFKANNNFQYTLGTVTNVKFH